MTSRKASHAGSWYTSNGKPELLILNREVNSRKALFTNWGECVPSQLRHILVTLATS